MTATPETHATTQTASTEATTSGATSTTSSNGEKSAILTQWEKMSALPLGIGRRLFDLSIGWMVPYTGTIFPHVVRLEPGYAEISISDWMVVRNHLKCIHAIALANLGELTANLAVMSLQPKTARWIVTKMEMEYVKKARGTITGKATAPAIDWTQKGKIYSTAELFDAAGEVVARARAEVLIDPLVKKEA